MLKAKPAANLQPISFEWDEQFKVLIQPVPQAKRLKLIKGNEEISYDKKHRQKTDTDWAGFGADLMRAAIAGWTGMTYRHLIDICDALVFEPGVKLGDAVEFTPEHLDFVVRNRRDEFALFVTHGLDRLTEIYAEQQKRELENL